EPLRRRLNQTTTVGACQRSSIRNPARRRCPVNFRLGPGRTNRAKVNRRSFLRGAGGLALGLPFLESMPSRSAWAQSASPVFSMFIVQSCGVVANSFWPSATGPLTADTMTGTASAGLLDYASKALFVGG